MFPFSIEGEFELGSLDSAGVRTMLDGVQLALAEAGGTAFMRTPVGIAFSGMLFGLNWEPLIMVGRSHVSVTTGAVSILAYRFSLIPSTLYSLGAIALVSALTFRSNPVETIIFALVALPFMVGGSYMIRSAELPAILRRGAGVARSSA